MRHVIFWGLVAGLIGQAGSVAAQDDLSRRLQCSDWASDIQPTEWGWVVRDCLAQQRYDAAVRAFIAYNSYIVFDQQRVRDESAHVVKDELHRWILSGLSRQQSSEMKAFVEQMRHKTHPFHPDTCASLQNLGPPAYTPQYMISRGLIPRKTADDWKTLGFDPGLAWARALRINGCD